MSVGTLPSSYLQSTKEAIYKQELLPFKIWILEVWRDGPVGKAFAA